MAPSAAISYHLQSTQILLGDFCRDSLEHKLLKYFSETLWLEISKLVGLDVGLSKHTEVSWKVFSYKFLNLQLIFLFAYHMILDAICLSLLGLVYPTTYKKITHRAVNKIGNFFYIKYKGWI